MSQPPPYSPPPPLDYGTPQPDPARNSWWKVSLRALAGLVAGLLSGAAGLGLVYFTNIGALFFVPAGIAFVALLVVCIKFRRFGYLSGFLLAPFLVFFGLVVTLLIICGRPGGGFR